MQVETVSKKRRTLWCPKPAQLPIQTLHLDKWNIDASISNRIADIAPTWDSVVPNESFAKSCYLEALESCNPDRLKNMYVVLSRDGREVGVVLLQTLVLRLAESFDYDSYTTNRSFWSKIWQKTRQTAISWITFRMLTVGNLYLTGQYGIHFKENGYSNQERFAIVGDLLKLLRKELCGTDYRFSGILYKDFFPEQSPDDTKPLSLIEFKIDPNMILNLRPSWLTFDDYLLDMKSKYRVRLKNAIKKFKGVERRILSPEEVVKYNGRMYELYNKILDGSGFVLAMGKENYFAQLQEKFGEELHVIGYFLNGEMIGFYTWVMEGEKMDSHFIGFEPQLNGRHQIYLNILLDLVKDGIAQKANSIYYFRTALEIKSSVGAEPQEMSCYFKHASPLLNKAVVPIAFKYFVPKQNWKQRHPFK